MGISDNVTFASDDDGAFEEGKVRSNDANRVSLMAKMEQNAKVDPAAEDKNPWEPFHAHEMMKNESENIK